MEKVTSVYMVSGWKAKGPRQYCVETEGGKKYKWSGRGVPSVGQTLDTSKLEGFDQ